MGCNKSKCQVVFFWETLVCHFCQFWSFHGGRVQNACVTLPNTHSSSGNPWHGIILAWLFTASILHTQIQSIRGKLSTYLSWNIKISHWSKSRRAGKFSCHCCFPLFEGKSHLLSDVFFGTYGSRCSRDFACAWWQQGETRLARRTEPLKLQRGLAWRGVVVWSWCVSLCSLEGKGKSKHLRSLGSFKTNLILCFLS